MQSCLFSYGRNLTAIFFLKIKNSGLIYLFHIYKFSILQFYTQSPFKYEIGHLQAKENLAFWSVSCLINQCAREQKNVSISTIWRKGLQSEFPRKTGLTTKVLDTNTEVTKFEKLFDICHIRTQTMKEKWVHVDNVWVVSLKCPF